MDPYSATLMITEFSLDIVFHFIDDGFLRFVEGSLRVDANVSVNETGGPLGTRTEIKNLNSLRSVARSIDYEIRRHIQILEANGRVVNETRGYDPQLKRTVSMRDKETKQDYRFMPEPNLPPLRLLQLGLEPSRLRSKIPTLPKEERRLIMDKYKLNLETTVQLVVIFSIILSTVITNMTLLTAVINIPHGLFIVLSNYIFLLNSSDKILIIVRVHWKCNSDTISLYGLHFIMLLHL